MTNRYPAPCAACGTKVFPGDGNTTKVADKWSTVHFECPDVTADIDNADAYARHLTDGPVLASWRDRVAVGDMDRGAYYDTTTYRVALPPGVSANAYRTVIARGDGRSMYAYGSFGGYSTIGNVTDNGDGTANVQSVYHIGD